MVEEKHKEYMDAELSQIWSQYRHTEESRMKQFTVFVTLLLAAVGFMGTQLSTWQIGGEENLINASTFVFAVFFVSGAFMSAFVELEILIQGYERILRAHRLAAVGNAYEDRNPFAIWKGIPKRTATYYEGAQTTSTVIAFSACMLLALGQFIFILQVVQPKHPTSFAMGIIWSIFGAMVLLLVWAGVHFFRYWWFVRKAREPITGGAESNDDLTG